MSNKLPDFLIDRANAVDGPVVFACARNERRRIEAWLSHYRALGLRKFIVIDNGSTDGTFELLAAQPDVALHQTAESYGAARFGLDWVNEFLGRVMPGKWVLFADIDELLAYRGWPDLSFEDFIAGVEPTGADAVLGLVLDMYPDGPVVETNAGVSVDMFAQSPCFDRDYHFRLRPKKPWEPRGKEMEIVGGPRVRLLSTYERECRSGWVDYLVRGQLDRILPHVSDDFAEKLIGLWPRQMPSLRKVALTRASPTGFRYNTSHDGGPCRFYRENVVVCHFKFLPDFVARIREEAKRKEHYRRGAEYIMYRSAVDAAGELDLRYEGSMRFLGVNTLLEHGLIRDIRPFMEPQDVAT